MSLPTNQVIDNDVRLPYSLFITSPNQAKYFVRCVASFFALPLIYTNAFSQKRPSLLIRDPLTLSVIDEDFFFIDLSVRITKIFQKSIFHISAMSLEESRRSQRPYRYGMVLLCVGALINWLGLAENYVEPVRYVGVACIVAGALLICAAMCCWLHAPPTRTSTHTQHTNHPITAQVIRELSTWRIYLLENKTVKQNPRLARDKLGRRPRQGRN